MTSTPSEPGPLDDPAIPRLSELVLVNLPPTAGPEAVEKAPPLGPRDKIVGIFAEVLPGAAFNEFGYTRFERSDYAIDVELADGDPVQSATIHLTGQPSTVATRRLLRKTGWRVYSPERRAFIDPEVLGTALAESAPSGAPAALGAPVAFETSDHAWSGSAEAARRYARPAAGLFVLLVLGTVTWYYTRGDDIARNEAQTIRELRIFGQANLALRAATGVFTTPEQLANPEYATQLGSSALPPLFATPVRHGYRFEITGEPVTELDQAFAFLEPAFRSYVYVALPVEPGKSGRRSFALISDDNEIYARDDLAIPTAEDQRVSGNR